MAEQFGEKSQEATAHRRQCAREEGQVAKSQDLASAVTLIAALVVLMALGGRIANFLGEFTQHQLGSPPSLRANLELATNIWSLVMHGLAKTLLPIFGLLFLAAVVIHVGQVGFLFLPQKLALDLNHINPLKGLQRLFSLSSAMRLVFGMVKVLIVAAVALGSLWSQSDAIMSLGSLDIQQIAVFIFQITFWICLKIGAALLILAILDYAYQRWKYEQDLRMTSHEVREEMKTLQGDPQILSRRRAVQRQLALNRLENSIPKADVVVTNPTELAVALQYDPETMASPLVVAKGAGVVAQRIRRLALEHDIPIVERKELAQILYKQIEVNQPVPAEQYAAVAEVLRYVYELNGKTLPGMQQAA